MDYLVDILMPVYNHEKFLELTLSGIVMQKADFNFRLIIGDDFSTDRSRTIIESFANKYPKIIHAFYRERNLGANENSRLLFIEMSSKYIALCEGDDYWTDPLKLQKQIGFLEANPEFTLSYHNVYELEGDKELVLTKVRHKSNLDTFTLFDLAEGNFIHTPSVVFRNIFGKGVPRWFSESPVGDYLLYMLVAEKGKIKYFPEPMAVYRRHTGIWSVQSQLTMWQKWFKVLDLLKTHFRDHEVLPVLKKQETEIINEIISITERLEKEVKALKSDPKEIAGKVTLKNLMSAIRIKAGNLFRGKLRSRTGNIVTE